ncbi:MAG: hypothetical protein GY869_03390 [Planctomycetes bacterium]|nr:hypothetical protein [Planctomycetota bacterium]
MQNSTIPQAAAASVDVEAQVVAMMQAAGYLLTTDGVNAVAVGSEYGVGQNFLHMSADGYPRWMDVQTLVEYVSGGLNRWAVAQLPPMPIPTGTALTPIATDHEPLTPTEAYSIPVASCTLTSAVIV